MPMVIGRPVSIVQIPLVCQPPRRCLIAPLTFPDGISQLYPVLKTCVWSKPEGPIEARMFRLSCGDVPPNSELRSVLFWKAYDATKLRPFQNLCSPFSVSALYFDVAIIFRSLSAPASG